jgi:hypothetical protein
LIFQGKRASGDAFRKTGPNHVSAFARAARVYVDECKSKGYYVAAAVVLHTHAVAIEKALRKLTRRGQRRIHFNQESDSSRRFLLSRMCEMEIRVVVYSVKGQHERVARGLCLNALVDDITTGGAQYLTLERDGPLEAHDRRTIREALIRNNRYELNYRHATPSEYAILWVSDAVAWCCSAGGDWRRRADPLIAEHRVL